jgi:hypothetical protein
MPTAWEILMNSLRSAGSCQYTFLLPLCLHGGEEGCAEENAQEESLEGCACLLAERIHVGCRERRTLRASVDELCAILEELLGNICQLL